MPILCLDKEINYVCIRYSAMIRNWLAYTGFLTMAAIAVTRSLGCLLFRCDREHVSRTVFKPRLTGLVCVSLWILAFVILSPITFSMTFGSYYFGTFGYDVKHGKCEVISCQPQEGFYPGGFLFSVAFFVPFIFILVSYLFISILLETEKRRKRQERRKKGRPKSCTKHTTKLCLLSVASKKEECIFAQQLN